MYSVLKVMEEKIQREGRCCNESWRKVKLTEQQEEGRVNVGTQVKKKGHRRAAFAPGVVRRSRLGEGDRKIAQIQETGCSRREGAALLAKKCTAQAPKERKSPLGRKSMAVAKMKERSEGEVKRKGSKIAQYVTVYPQNVCPFVLVTERDVLELFRDGC